MLHSPLVWVIDHAPVVYLAVYGFGAALFIGGLGSAKRRK